MDIKIIVATHKKYWMPEDEIYLPVHVGAEGKTDDSGEPLDLGYVKDNSGDNISGKNKQFCELTGLYWAWKNLDADYVGLAHYRRHFTVKGKRGSKKEKPITGGEIEEMIGKYDVFLPKKRHYYIETNYSQYAHAHHAVDLDTTRQIIEEKHPDYLTAFDECMKKRGCHIFNMFIMSRDVFEKYCSWLFDILFELERRLDISTYSDNDSRVFGFVAERLMDVFLETNKVKYKELPYVFMEKQNWIKKGGHFLKRKIGI